MDRTELERRVTETLPLLGQGTFYDLLGVPSNATDDQIRTAFHERALVFHVDRYTEDLGALREPMQRIFGELSKAHATLTSPPRRAEYDAGLELADRGIPTDVRALFAADEAFRSGKRLVDRGGFAQAFDQLTKAVQLNGAEPDYWAYLYWAEFGTLETDRDGVPVSTRRVNEIRTRLEELVRDHERCASALVFLGHIHRVEGDVEKARRYYKRALEIDRTHLEAQSSLRLLNMRKEKSKASFLDRLFKRG